MDVMTPEERSRCMAAVKSNDAKPEMLVRRYLHALGFRYGIHNKKLSGSPDLVLRKYRTVIFVNGCFWHGHEGCKLYRLPKSNVEFWQAKVDRNRERDARTTAELAAKGWRVITVWECELKTAARREETLARLAATIRGDRPSYLPASEDIPLAAEPETEYK